MPEYKVPSLKRAVFSMLSRGWAFIVKATTVIMICNTVVQLMLTFDWTLNVAESADKSIIATVATPFAYLFAPVVGIVSWQLAAAAITGFIAKENVVGTLAVCVAGLDNLIDTEELVIIGGAGGEIASLLALTQVAALAYLMFNLFTPPCFAAIGAMNSEIKVKKWFWGAIGLQFGTGYSVAFLVCQIGTLITTGSLALGFIPGLVGVLAFAGYLTYLALRAKKTDKAIEGANK